jgi:peroxiredoxin
LIVGLVVLLLGSVIGCGDGTPGEGARPGDTAPDFRLPTLDGEIVSLSEFRGQPVFLNFWATWCGPCRAEMPYIQQLYERWTGQGLVVLAIDIQESPDTVRDFVEEFEFTFPVLMAADADVPLSYNVRSIPTSVFIDADGIIREVKRGAFVSEVEIERILLKIMP